MRTNKHTCENYNRRQRRRRHRRQQQRNEHNNCGVATQVFLITPSAPCNEQYPHYAYDLGRFFPLVQLRTLTHTRVFSLIKKAELAIILFQGKGFF